MRALAALAIAFASLPARVSAEEEPNAGSIGAGDGRHWGAGIGGFSALTGPADYGLTVGGELYPGGGFGRYGIRAELRGYENGDDGQAAVGVTYIAAASRPRLQLALHGELGMTSQQQPIAGLGVQTQLWIKWPLAVALDGGGTLIVDGTETALAISSSLQLRIAY